VRITLIMGLLVLIGFVVLAVGYSAEQASLRRQAETARTISNQFAKTLKTQLVDAMQSGGPEHAVSICQRIAPVLATQFSIKGWQVGRTALKLRNPANAPDAWERSVLLGFSEAMQNGIDPATLERFGFFANNNGRKTFRYMKAIPIGAPCLACHGSNISPDVQVILAARYPEDQAIDFKQGDLRGAFTLSREMPAPSP
jgi:Protein of unknown function (DUF3365)